MRIGKHRFRTRIAEIQTISWALECWVSSDKEERDILTTVRTKWKLDFDSHFHYKHTPEHYIMVSIDSKEELEIIYKALSNKMIKECKYLPSIPYGKYHNGITECDHREKMCSYVYDDLVLGFQVCRPIIMKNLRDRIYKVYHKWYGKE